MDAVFFLVDMALSIWALSEQTRTACARTPAEPDRWTPPEQWQVTQVVAGGTTLPPDRNDPLYDRDLDG